MIQGAQLSNSFIILMALYESEKPLNSTEISEIISSKTSGKIIQSLCCIKRFPRTQAQTCRVCRKYRYSCKERKNETN